MKTCWPSAENVNNTPQTQILFEVVNIIINAKFMSGSFHCLPYLVTHPENSLFTIFEDKAIKTNK